MAELAVLKGSQDFLHKWDVKNGFAYVLTFFSLISDGLGSVSYIPLNGSNMTSFQQRTGIVALEQHIDLCQRTSTTWSTCSNCNHFLKPWAMF